MASDPPASTEHNTILVYSNKPPSEVQHFGLRGSDIVRVFAPPNTARPVEPEELGITTTNAAGLCKYCQLLLHPSAPTVIAHKPSLLALVESKCHICGVLNASLGRGAPQLGELLGKEYELIDRGVAPDEHHRARVQVTVALAKHEKFTRAVPTVGPRSPMADSGVPVEFARVEQLGPLASRRFWQPYRADRTPGPERLELVKEWLRDCETKHEDCAAFCAASRTAKLPTRVLDLTGSPDSPTSAEDIKIKLLETAPDQTGRYVTLSYCWGTDPQYHYKTTTATLAGHKAEIEFAALPLTHREAILTTLNLGLRYLWIDALCIVQDSAGDWERESASMSSVYSHAYLSLAATSGENPGAGLLDPFQTAFCEEDIGGKKVMVRLATRDYVDAAAQPLNRRAWTLQERELAPRSVGFGAEQWLWRCPGRWTTEDGLVDRARSEQERAGVLWSPSSGDLSRGKTGGDGGGGVNDQVDLTSRESRALFKYWNNLVEAYTRRHLTFASDKGKAIAGLASAFAARTHARYVAGLWQEDLAAGLLWNATSRGVHRRADAIPSWSWVSTEGPIMMSFSSPSVSVDESDGKEKKARRPKSQALPLTLHNAEESWSGVPGASELLVARLTVEGKVLNARIGPRSETQRLRYHLIPLQQQEATGEVLGETILDDAEGVEKCETDEVVCLFLYTSTSDFFDGFRGDDSDGDDDADDRDPTARKDKEYFAVLLVPASPEHQRGDGIMAYKRIGIAIVWMRSRLGVGIGKGNEFSAAGDERGEETFIKASDAKVVLV